MAAASQSNKLADGFGVREITYHEMSTLLELGTVAARVVAIGVGISEAIEQLAILECVFVGHV